MDLATVKLFCDIVETRSFSAAADRSYITQSACSQRIRALETRLGQLLLERGKGRAGAVPTRAGSVLYEGGMLLLTQVEALENRIAGISSEPAGTIRVATVYSVGLHALPGRLKPFLAANPAVNVHLEYSQTGKVVSDVLSGTADIGIVACPAPARGIEILPFLDEMVVLICAPESPLSANKTIALTDLIEREFIGFAEGIPTRKLIDEKLKQRGVRVRMVAAFDNIETIKNLVEIGTGVALVPETSALRESSAGSLIVIPLDQRDSFVRPSGLLVKRAGTRSAAVRSFLTAISAPPRGNPA